MKNNEKVACLSAGAGQRPPALQSVQAQGEVHGLLLRMTLRQAYRNNSDEDLEVVYSFPLAWGTTLLGMAVELNGKRMTGAVVEKSEAEATYEQAVEQGDLPVMLVKEGKNLYSARLGSLKPGDEAVIEIDYGQLLVPDGGRTRITVPTTIAPRFGRDPGLKGLLAHAIGAIDALAEYRFFLTLTLHGPLARGRIACPSHAVSQQMTEDGMRIELSQKAMLDRDFVLTVEANDFAGSWASPEPGDTQACTMLSSFVPALPARAEAPLAVKILIDCSGSMAGDSMQLAQHAIAAAIRQLRPTDTVSFSRFGSTTVHVIDRLVPMNEANLKRLLQALGDTDADLGGTELDSALKQTIALPGPRGEVPEAASILLITDGEVWDIENIVATARQSGHQLYVVGVGSAPSESLVRELAEVTGGAAELAAPGEDIVAATGRLMAKMRSMRDLEVAIEMDGERLALPAHRYRVAPGEVVHVWYSLPQRPVTAPHIVVMDRASGVAQQVPEAPLEWHADSTVARMGAARRLLDVSEPALRRELALKYQLMTDETRFLLVHERSEADKASGMPALQQVGQMPAAGWAGAGRVRIRDIDQSAMRFMRIAEEPRFLRRQADAGPAPASPPPMWSRGVSEPAAQYDIQFEAAEVPVPAYDTLGEMVAAPAGRGNPLQELADRFEAHGADAAALPLLLAHIDSTDAMAALRPLLKALEGIVGSREAALALLLDWWDNQNPGAPRMSAQASQSLASSLAAVMWTTEDIGRAYLDGVAAHASHLPERKARGRRARAE